MLESLAVLLLAVALIQLLSVLAARLSTRNRVRSAQRWSRRAHTHEWRAMSTVGYATEAGVWTVITEECQRCPAMRLVQMPGAWGLNRFDELVNLSPEEIALTGLR